MIKRANRCGCTHTQVILKKNGGAEYDTSFREI